MRKLLFGAGLVAASLLVENPSLVAAQSGPAAEIIDLVNELRAANGLPAYQVDSALMAAAQAHTDWSASVGTSTHTGQGGTTPNDRAQAAGYGGGAWSWATENSAGGTLPFITPEWVVTMWQGDDVHLRAMISPDYEHIGVGYAEADGYAYYTMMVGWVADEPAPIPTSPPQPETTPPEAEAAEVAPAAPSFVLATPGPDGSIVHEVQAGQSVWQIAAYYGVEVDDLLALNGLTEDTFLHEGDTLVIRPADVPQDESEPTPAQPTPDGEPAQPTAIALELPPKLTPLATDVASRTLPPETSIQGPGPFRKLATVAIAALGVIGVALAGWALWQRRRESSPRRAETD